MKHFGDIHQALQRVQDEETTRKLAFLILPGFSLLDLASAIELLAIVNRLSRANHYDWKVVSADGNSVQASNGTAYPVDGGLAQNDPTYERIFVCAFDGHKNPDPQIVASWLRRQARMGAQFGALGTGATRLVQAGIVGSRDFTLHWSFRQSFLERNPELIPTSQIFTNDKGLLTCAGGQSVTDMMLALIENNHGNSIASKVADHLIGSVPRTSDTPQRISLVHRFGTRHPQFLSIMAALETDESYELTIERILSRHPISRRQLERLFKRYCGTSPSRYLKFLRLERARELLNNTEMSVLEVAVACGFGSVANFSKSFAQRYECRPSDFRSIYSDFPEKPHIESSI